MFYKTCLKNIRPYFFLRKVVNVGWQHCTQWWWGLFVHMSVRWRDFHLLHHPLGSQCVVSCSFETKWQNLWSKGIVEAFGNDAMGNIQIKQWFNACRRHNHTDADHVFYYRGSVQLEYALEW